MIVSLFPGLWVVTLSSVIVTSIGCQTGSKMGSRNQGSLAAPIHISSEESFSSQRPLRSFSVQVRAIGGRCWTACGNYFFLQYSHWHVLSFLVPPPPPPLQRKEKKSKTAPIVQYLYFFSISMLSFYHDCIVLTTRGQSFKLLHEVNRI